jgi:hypothetical protein
MHSGWRLAGGRRVWRWGGTLALLVALLAFVAVRTDAACSITRGTDGNDNSKLTIKGDALPQTILIADSALTVRVRIDCNNDGAYVGAEDQTFPATEIFEIAGGGKDNIQYGFGSAATVRRSLLVSLGPSTPANVNGVSIRLDNISGASSITVDVQGSAGPDQVYFDAADVLDSALVLRADLGAGDDRVDLRSHASFSNVSVTRDLDLGPGNNTLLDSLYEAVLTRTAHDTVLRGGDVAAQTDFDGFYLSGVTLFDGSRLVHDSRLLLGNDRFQELIGELKINGSEVDVRARGGAGNDSLALQGAAPIDLATLALFATTLLGGPGNDVVSADVDYYDPGTLRLALGGGDGDDVLVGGVVIDSTATAVSSDLLFEGGKGADVLYLAAADPAGRGIFGPSGTALLWGGALDASADACFTFGGSPMTRLGCEGGS